MFYFDDFYQALHVHQVVTVWKWGNGLGFQLQMLIRWHFIQHLMCQCCNPGTGEEGPWILSRPGAGGQMARNGGAPGTWWLVRSTASVTCTVDETVQESLWKSPQPPPLSVAEEEEEGLLLLPPAHLLLLRLRWEVGRRVGPILLFLVHPLPLICSGSTKGKATTKLLLYFLSGSNEIWIILNDLFDPTN